MRGRGKKAKAKLRCTPSMTICWECANAVPDRNIGRGCSWSMDFEPVEGWTAERTKIKNRGKVAEESNSYQVIACPEFVEG